MHAGNDQITDGVGRQVIVESPTDLFTVHQNLTRKLTWKDNAKDLKCVASHIALDGAVRQTIKQINVRCEYMSNDSVPHSAAKTVILLYTYIPIHLAYMFHLSLCFPFAFSLKTSSVG